MKSKEMAIREATERWVREMNAIPQEMIKRLMKATPDDWQEITVPTKNDEVYVYETNNEHYGTITAYDPDKKKYTVTLDDGTRVTVTEDDFEVVIDSVLPMWGTMWSFDDSCDEYWLEEQNGIRKMSECGFRIFESEEFGYFFGIDGAGYDFYSEHWVPLYKARGLHWHENIK